MFVPETELKARKVPLIDLTDNEYGFGRELFAGFRQMAGRADEGARCVRIGIAFRSSSPGQSDRTQAARPIDLHAPWLHQPPIFD